MIFTKTRTAGIVFITELLMENGFVTTLNQNVMAVTRNIMKPVTALRKGCLTADLVWKLQDVKNFKIF